MSEGKGVGVMNSLPRWGEPRLSTLPLRPSKIAAGQVAVSERV